MSAATPAALQNFGSFVFGNHALNLEQKIILRGTADRTVQENNLRARAVKLIDQQHLMGVTAGEPVRSMDVNALDMAASNRIPQPLQRRAKQDRTTVAFIDVVVIRFELKAVGSDPLPQRGDLAGDRIIARLTLARHACIERTLCPGHALPPSLAAIANSPLAGRVSPRVGRRLVRCTIGTRRAYASIR
jgi:hypothetical protein